MDDQIDEMIYELLEKSVTLVEALELDLIKNLDERQRLIVHLHRFKAVLKERARLCLRQAELMEMILPGRYLYLVEPSQ